MNFIHIAGHLGADPEVRFTSNGQKVTTLRVAARTRKKNKDETIWWRCTIWGDQFEKMIPYLKKGSPIMVIGELVKPEIFTDREGKPQVSMELTVVNIQFSPFGRGSDRSANTTENVTAAENTTNNETMAFQTTSAFEGISQGNNQESANFTNDDEIPF